MFDVNRGKRMSTTVNWRQPPLGSPTHTVARVGGGMRLYLLRPRCAPGSAIAQRAGDERRESAGINEKCRQMGDFLSAERCALVAALCFGWKNGR